MGSLARDLDVPFGDEALLFCFAGADLCLLSAAMVLDCTGVELLDGRSSGELEGDTLTEIFLLAERADFNDCPSGSLKPEK